ncbi:hypothetical protein GCM10010123_05630 [Pilimelia anulata]|uniref:DUF1206 domain-containing protein n=1 Tax=Pilimelia anulata TaxID=53371 RepID=A0A8J3F7H4_9ACTN|nr:DUF1206 domain-containing protein [Pilimelia anulata]GGJ78538.1 hypothetical protein GCM10010123_05630 [Pilimelia anulata]
MNAAARAGHAVRRVARHPAITRTARAGLVGFGLVHLLIAWLAVLIALGRPAPEGDQSGALHQLAAQPAGVWLVGAVALGLAALVVWQATTALAGPYRARAGEWGRRAIAAGRAVVYGAAAGTALGVLRHARPSSAAQQQTATARLMEAPGGRVFVGAAGVVVAAIGLGMLGYGVLRRYERKLDTGRMPRPVRRLTAVAGVAGYGAKGVAYGVAGVLVLLAAVHFDPGRSRGLDAALRTLAAQPAGAWLLGAVALGFACYATVCVIQSRYRTDL